MLTFPLDNPRTFTNQRYNQRGNYSGPHSATNNPGMFVPSQYMMGNPNGTDPSIQPILNNKFFQTRGLPGSANPCAYQSMGQGQGPYNQYSAPMQYAYSPYTQPPTAAVQQ